MSIFLDGKFTGFKALWMECPASPQAGRWLHIKTLLREGRWLNVVNYGMVQPQPLQSRNIYLFSPSVSEVDADSLCANTMGRKVISMTNIATTLVTGRSRGRVNWLKIQMGRVVS
jgi:hypothetical protein